MRIKRFCFCFSFWHSFSCYRINFFGIEEKAYNNFILAKEDKRRNNVKKLLFLYKFFIRYHFPNMSALPPPPPPSHVGIFFICFRCQVYPTGIKRETEGGGGGDMGDVRIIRTNFIFF